MTPTERAQRFEVERGRLRAIAYRMLGTPDDADDVVQDAWLRFEGCADDIERPEAWLTTVVTRLSVDRLRSARTRRETYVGPWLADPVFDVESSDPQPADLAILAESLSLGFLAVLERLSPAERAAFLLHDVFAVPFADIATTLDRSEAATRQLAKRARDHVASARPRYAADPADIAALSDAFLSAALNGDLETLESLLAADVIHVSDGGPHHRAARAPIVGPARVARFFVNLAKRVEPGMAMHSVRANGQAAVYVTVDGEPYMVLVSNFVDGQLAASFAVRNPDKLRAFHREWLSAEGADPPDETVSFP